MPGGLAGVVIAVAADVVEVGAEEVADGLEDARMVEQRAEPGALVDERDHGGALGAVMLQAVGDEDRLEVGDDPAGLGPEQAGQLEEAEGLEERALLGEGGSAHGERGTGPWSGQISCARNSEAAWRMKFREEPLALRLRLGKPDQTSQPTR